MWQILMPALLLFALGCTADTAGPTVKPAEPGVEDAGAKPDPPSSATAPTATSLDDELRSLSADRTPDPRTVASISVRCMRDCGPVLLAVADNFRPLHEREALWWGILATNGSASNAQVREEAKRTFLDPATPVFRTIAGRVLASDSSGQSVLAEMFRSAPDPDTRAAAGCALKRHLPGKRWHEYDLGDNTLKAISACEAEPNPPSSATIPTAMSLDDELRSLSAERMPDPRTIASISVRCMSDCGPVLVAAADRSRPPHERAALWEGIGATNGSASIALVREEAKRTLLDRATPVFVRAGAGNVLASDSSGQSVLADVLRSAPHPDTRAAAACALIPILPLERWREYAVDDATEKAMSECVMFYQNDGNFEGPVK